MIHPDKCQKLLDLIVQLQRHRTVPVKTLQKFLGLMLWVTQLFPYLRIWLHYLFRDLRSIPATQYSLDPSQLLEFRNSLTEDLIFSVRPPGTAILALLEAVKRACMGLNIVVHAEPAPTGDHQANGAAESMVGVLRSKANLLVSQIEEATGCKGPIFGCMRPVYAWALIHSAWLHNHFSVKRAMISYERTTGRFYAGKVAMYGETVLGYLKTSLKGLPQWTRGIWLSKTISNDCHIIGTPTGIFITRSIRRLPDSFQLELLGELTASPWEYGHANLGHRLIYSRRSSLPPGVAVGTTLSMGDTGALAVRDYARAHPYEDVEAKALSAQVGDFTTSTPAEAGEQPPVHAQAAGDSTEAASSAQASDSGIQQGADSMPVSGKHGTTQNACILKVLTRKCHMAMLCLRLHNLKLDTM